MIIRSILAMDKAAVDLEADSARTLYVSRTLTNASDVIEWARAHGFRQTLEPKDMHVTVAFSRNPLDWDAVGKQTAGLSVESGKREVSPLGDKGGIVLLFDCPELTERWQQFRNAGASWDWPEYRPHITLTYSGDGAPDLATVQPYSGALKFGPEKFAEVDDNWTDKIKEKASAEDIAADAKLAMDRGYRRDGKRIVPTDLIALDRSPSVRTFDQDGQLHISRTPISKANVGEYWGREIPDAEKLGLDPDRKYRLFRDPAELEKGAKSSNGKQVLVEHVPVSADDHKPDITVGALGTDAEYEHPYLYNSMTIHARDGIDGIEDDSRRQISMAYHYKPIMEPGEYEGEPYDGRMTDILFNHCCLVEAGRAGADVLVQDTAISETDRTPEKAVIALGLDTSIRNSDPSEKEAKMPKIVLTRKAAMAGGALSAYLGPKLAKDSQFNVAAILSGVTAKNFKAKRPDIITGLRKAKLAQDASIDVDDIGKVLDMIENCDVEEGADSDPNSGLPMSAEEMEKKKAKDADPMNKAKEFLSGKLSAEDMKAFDDLMGTPAAEGMDETPEEKTAREKKEKDEADKPGEDEEPKVTKKAMDAAIRVAVQTASKTATADALKIANAISGAREFVAPWAGKIAMDATSAEDIYKGALDVLKVDVTDVHPSAYRTILNLQPKPGEQHKPRIAQDNAFSGGKSIFADVTDRISLVG